MTLAGTGPRKSLFVELQSAWAERFAEMVADAQDEDDGADDKDGEEGEGAKADLIINP